MVFFISEVFSPNIQNFSLRNAQQEEQVYAGYLFLGPIEDNVMNFNLILSSFTKKTIL